MRHFLAQCFQLDVIINNQSSMNNLKQFHKDALNKFENILQQLNWTRDDLKQEDLSKYVFCKESNQFVPSDTLDLHLLRWSLRGVKLDYKNV